MSTFDSTAFTTSILSHIGTWLPRGWVWRKSPLGPLQTLLTVVSMVAFGSKGYRTALRDVFADMHRAFGWGEGTPTPSALTQARGKLSEKMCRDLFRRVSKEAGRVPSRARLSYVDFQRIVAVDGTRTALASTAGLKRDFGCPFGEHLAPQALLTVLWDLGGNVPVDWRLGPHDGSEQADLNDMLGSLGVGDLLLADRLYPSRELMAELHRRGIHFVMRVKTAGTRLAHEIAAFVESGLDDQTVPLPGHPSMRIRMVRGQRDGSEHIVLVTSLVDAVHDARAVADLFQRRWGIETAYREAKGWHGLDALPGRSKQMVRQEVCALMLFWLMQGELEGQARRVYAEEIRKQPDVDSKWTPAQGIAEVPVLFNRKLLATSVALLMAAAVAGMDEAVKSWRVSIRYLWQNRARRRPGRQARRTSERPHSIKFRDEISSAAARGGRNKGGASRC
jgi:hypothetical protein